MPIYNYVAKKVSGEEIKGSKEAKDRFDLAQMVRSDGYIMLSYEQKKERKFSLDFFDIRNVSTADKMIFSRNLGVMVSAGLSIVKGLEILSRQTKNKKFKKIILALIEGVQKGNPLSESMKGYPSVFSSLFVAMVKVGEESGQLSQSLKNIGEQLGQDHSLSKKIRGAMIYPAIIIIAMIVVGILMLIYVVPTLISTFRDLNLDLPASTRAIIFLSDFMAANSVLVLGFFLLITLVIFWFFRTERGKRAVSFTLLYFPLFSSIVKKVNSARTSRTLASLISSGVNVLEALSITEEVLQNYRYKKVLEEAKASIQKGAPISETFKKFTNLYPVLVGEMMSVGEETGKLSEMLSRLAVFYEEEVSNATKDLATVIEPILMVIIGTVVGFFVISMISPMYSMMGSV